MSTENDKIAMAVGAFLALALPAALGLAAAWSGFAYATVWNWYAVPIFGAPVLAWWQAAGLSLLVGALHRDDYTKKETDGWKMATSIVVRPAIILAFGWFYRAVGA